jgi:hypothetical protein
METNVLSVPARSLNAGSILPTSLAAQGEFLAALLGSDERMKGWGFKLRESVCTIRQGIKGRTKILLQEYPLAFSIAQ